MDISYQIRVKASAVAINQELKLGDDVSCIMMGSITDVTDTDNQDGSITRTYHVKGQFAECITRDKEQIIKDGKTNKTNGRSKTESQGLFI